MFLYTIVIYMFGQKAVMKTNCIVKFYPTMPGMLESITEAVDYVSNQKREYLM